MNNQISNDSTSTSDLALATTLSLNFPILSIDKSNPRKASFIFKSDEKLQLLIQAYWAGTVRVNPQVYFNQLRVIKSRLYEEQNAF